MTSELRGWVIGNIEEFSKKCDINRDSINVYHESSNNNLIEVRNNQGRYTLRLRLRAYLVKE